MKWTPSGPAGSNIGLLHFLLHSHITFIHVHTNENELKQDIIILPPKLPHYTAQSISILQIGHLSVTEKFLHVEFHHNFKIDCSLFLWTQRQAILCFKNSETKLYQTIRTNAIMRPGLKWIRMTIKQVIGSVLDNIISSLSRNNLLLLATGKGNVCSSTTEYC